MVRFCRTALVLGTGALTLGLTSPAGAGGVRLLTMSADPGTVEAGSTTTVTNDEDSECFGDVEVTLGTPTEVVENTTGDIDGDWSVTVTVPAGTPAGEYAVDATCTFLEAGMKGRQGDITLDYQAILITVTQAPPSSTSTTTTTMATTSTVPPTTAAPAVVTPAQPRFTG